MVVKHTSHARFDLWYHVVFSTKYRKKIWTEPATKEQVETLMRAIARQYDLEVGSMTVLSDHVHFTMSAPPRIAPSRAIQILKSLSTRKLFQQFLWLKQHYWGGEIWIAGYFIRSVGPGLTKEDIERYIDEQSEEV